MSIIEESSGILSHKDLATFLNSSGLTTRTGLKWTRSNIHSYLYHNYPTYKRPEYGCASYSTQSSTIEIILSMSRDGYSADEVADYLNDKGIRAARGGTWLPKNVLNQKSRAKRKDMGVKALKPIKIEKSTPVTISNLEMSPTTTWNFKDLQKDNINLKNKIKKVELENEDWKLKFNRAIMENTELKKDVKTKEVEAQIMSELVKKNIVEANDYIDEVINEPNEIIEPEPEVEESDKQKAVRLLLKQQQNEWSRKRQDSIQDFQIKMLVLIACSFLMFVFVTEVLL